MGQLVSILKQTPLSIRLKATARAITLLKKKNSDSNDHKISWFNNCIRPALAVPHAVNYQEFAKDEIATIKAICEFNTPNTLTEEEAFSYLKLLNNGEMLDLNVASNHFGDKSLSFWNRVLVDICKIETPVAQVWA